MKTLLLIAVASLCFAGSESPVSRAAIKACEGSVNDTFRTNSPDPYELLGTARGTYLDGYGFLVTFEMQLVVVQPPNPFKLTISPKELESIHERKLKKLPALKESMRNLMMNASVSLPGVPPGEKIAMEAILWNYSWEKLQGIPHRVFMTARREKLLAAQANHTPASELAGIIEEQEQ